MYCVLQLDSLFPSIAFVAKSPEAESSLSKLNTDHKSRGITSICSQLLVGKISEPIDGVNIGSSHSTVASSGIPARIGPVGSNAGKLTSGFRVCCPFVITA